MNTNPITLFTGGVFGADGMAATNAVGRYIKLVQSKTVAGGGNERTKTLGFGGRTIQVSVLENIGANTTLAEVQAKLAELNAADATIYTYISDELEDVLTKGQNERLAADAGLRAGYTAQHFYQPERGTGYFNQSFLWDGPKADVDLRVRQSVAIPAGAGAELAQTPVTAPAAAEKAPF